MGAVSFIFTSIHLKQTFVILHSGSGVIALTQILKCGRQLFSAIPSLGLVLINLPQPCFHNEEILLSAYMRLDSPFHPLLPFFLSLSPPLPSLECTLRSPPLLLFQYLWNHKNPSAMSHFSKANLILSRQPMHCTSGNDGCCSTCEENVLA